MAESKDTDKDIQAVRDDLNRLRDDFDRLMKALHGEAGEEFEELRDRIGSTLRDEADGVRHKAESASRKVRETSQGVRESVEEHPFTSALVALCTGLITGVVISGRK
jgi:ElaB/YqjD/DUF883 family membrane-anchored ribosome-binding protein